MVKRYVKYCLLASTVVLLTAAATEKIAAKTYLETDKNYYTEAGVHRGFLDKEISAETIGQENWEKFQVAVTKNLVIYKPGMTFNEYYLANKIAVEDNFQVYRAVGYHGSQDILLPSGGYLNVHPNPRFAGVDYITYVGPSDDRGAYWRDTELEDPILFSRLTVGQPAFGVFSRTGWSFPNQIGYGEAATVNDYMLTPENDIVIPTRFNTKREDVYLTMRSRALFGAGLRGAQAYLSATSNGQPVVGSTANPSFYIDTTSGVFMTDKAYDQLGLWNKFSAPSVYISTNRQLQLVGAEQFTTVINQGLNRIQNASGVNTVVSGNGGQIQLKGFDRQTTLDTQYTASDTERATDALRTVDVTYYMYTTGDSEVTLKTPLASNGQHLYSPNESVFKMETTRPYFENFGDTDIPIVATTAQANFAGTLGVDSFGVTDNGIAPDGEAIGVDKSRVRVRISTDDGATIGAEAYTLEALQEALEGQTLPEGQLTLYYTYAAKDAQDSILGKLSTEIADNTGAYAVPFTRKLDTTKRYSLTYQFASLDSSRTLPLSVLSALPEDTNQYVSGQEVTLKQPAVTDVSVADGVWEFMGYPTEKITFAAADQTVIGTWRFVPRAKGSILVRFVDTKGNELKTETPVSNVFVGEAYDVSRPSNDTIEVNGKTYRYKQLQDGSPAATGTVAPGNTIVTFVYEEDTTVAPLAKGSLLIKMIDKASRLLATIAPSAYTNVDEGTDYDIHSLATEEIEINGTVYTKVGLQSGSLIGKIGSGTMEVVLVYEEKVVTPPSSSSSTSTSSSSTSTSSSSSTTQPSTSTIPSSSSDAPDTEPSSTPEEPRDSEPDKQTSPSTEVRHVVVRPNGALPKTGENKSVLVATAGLGLLVAGLGVGLSRTRKEEK